MKRFNYIISILIGLFLTNVSIAGDVEDIKKATREHFATQNAGDAKAHIAHHMPYHTQFIGGGLLIVSHSREEQVKSLQEVFDAGVKFSLDLAHLEVKVYGQSRSCRRLCRWHGYESGRHDLRVQSSTHGSAH